MDFFVTPDGYVQGPQHRWRCALGRGQVGLKSKEGDGITPQGRHKLGRVFWRSDRLEPIQTRLNCTEITDQMGWCDDLTHPDYNILVALPHPAHHEQMWREDHVYDIVVELLYNTNPIVSGHGSAIFMHVARPGYTHTEGCIALNLNDLLQLLNEASVDSWINVARK